MKQAKTKSLIIFLAIFAGVFLFAKTSNAADPVLFYSDLNWGPRTGWENGTAKGAAVTIYGQNFGSVDAANKITVGGVDILSNNSTFIAEWNAAAPARGDKYITFWIPPTATTGSQTMLVTAGGATSNTLPLEISDSEAIFYISPSGNNSNSGRTTALPKRDIYQLSDAYNPLGDGQYIIYARGGTYNTPQPGYPAALYHFGTAGSSAKRKALVGYPGETAIWDASANGFLTMADYGGPGPWHYLTLAKITISGGDCVISNHGDYNRLVGIKFMNNAAHDQCGVLGHSNSQYWSVFGNYFLNGTGAYGDRMKHIIYPKTNPSLFTGDKPSLNLYIGWNELTENMGEGGGLIFLSVAGGAVGVMDNVYIHDNYFHDNRDTNIYMGDNNPINNVFVYNNVFANDTISDNSNGIMSIGPVGSSSLVAYVFNNTFYKVGLSGTPIINTTSAGRSVLRNNILYGNTGQTYIYHDTGTSGTSTNDLFYGGGAVPGEATNYQSGNPNFANAAGADFHLSATSTLAIGNGTTAGSPYPVNSILTTDYDGLTRGAAYDIGAYEYVSAGGGDTTPPAVPTGLTVQ